MKTFKEDFMEAWNDPARWTLPPFKRFWTSIVGYAVIIAGFSFIYAVIKVGI